MTIGVTGFGCEDALNHLLNFIWPNIFENSPHVCQAVHACLEGMRISLGPIRVFQYAVQVTPPTFGNSQYFSYLGSVPSGKKGQRSLLANLQQPLSRSTGIKTRKIEARFFSGRACSSYAASS